MDYGVWAYQPVGNVCMLDSIENVPRWLNLMRGVAFKDKFPAAAQYQMSKDHKKETGLNDDLPNTDSVKVCSARLVDFLKKKDLKNVEYLPVSILNHKGKLASKDYFIVHPVIPQDALDADASQPSFNDINPEEIDSVERLVLNKRSLDPELRLFRLKAFFKPVLIDKKLADEIKAAGFVGSYIQALERYRF
jgi:hypothetical protein